MSDLHESFERDEPAGSSDRSFGIVFAVALCVVAAIRYWRGHGVWEWLAVAALFFALALIAPRALEPLNRAWLKLGRLLNRVTNPLVMGIIFFLAVTPTALILRAQRKLPLPLHPDPEARSYWIERNPPGPAPSTMKHQF